MTNLPEYNLKKIEDTKFEKPELTIKSAKKYKNENEYINNDSVQENISISFEEIKNTTNREINTNNENSSETKVETKEKIPLYLKAWNAIRNTGATIAVGATSVMSGIADIGEAAVDGVTWVGGKVVEGGSWVAGETAGIFNKDVKQDIMDWRDDAKTNVRDFISTDWVDEANKAFYEGNSLGQYINDNSYLKYDSKTAQTIEGISDKVGELAIATGATILTGGVAAPLVCGTLVGFGESSETMYQLNPESSPLTEVIILGTGGLNGIAWAANGKLGASFTTEIGKSLGEVGVKETATNLAESFTKPEFLKSWLKKSLTDKGNYISSAMMSTDDLIGFMTGEKEVNAENATLLGIEFLKNFGLNTLEDGVRLGIGGFKAPSTEETITTIKLKTGQIDDLETTQTTNIISDQTKALDVENITPPPLNSSQKITDDYISNLSYYQQQGISFQDYLETLGINTKNFNSTEEVATYLGDGKLYLLDILQSHLKDGNLTPEQSTELNVLLNKYRITAVADIDPLEILNESHKFMTQDQIEKALNLFNFGNVEKWAEGLSDQQLASVFNYTACGGFELNAYLNDTTLPTRNGGVGPRARDRFSSISEIQDLVSGYVLSPVRKNRDLKSADADIISELDSVISQSSYDDAIVSYRGLKSLYDSATGKIDPSTLVPGVSFTSGGYQSSSILFDNNYGARNDDTNIILQVIIPPHSGSAAYIENITGVTNYGQMEVLIKRNAKMTVVGDVMKKVINGVEKTIVPVVVQ